MCLRKLGVCGSHRNIGDCRGHEGGSCGGYSKVVLQGSGRGGCMGHRKMGGCRGYMKIWVAEDRKVGLWKSQEDGWLQIRRCGLQRTGDGGGCGGHRKMGLRELYEDGDCGGHRKMVEFAGS